MQEIMKKNIKFYSQRTSANGRPVPSIEARLLFPLKVLAYGVSPNAFCDYFQLSMTQARQTCIIFDKTINYIWRKQYMSPPTLNQLKSIIKLHKHVHKVDGMLGCLDCSHTWWKKCPVGVYIWLAGFLPREEQETINCFRNYV